MFNETLIQTYNNVFAIQKHANIVHVSPPIVYIINKLYALTDCPSETDVLQCTRQLPDNVLVEILFKAVAGDYITGRGALSSASCTIVADPVTGYLSVVDTTQENRTILTIFVFVLLICVGWILYSPFIMRTSLKNIK